MSGIKASVHSYNIHLNQPLRIADQTIHERTIAGVTLTEAAEVIGYGEVSPLPGLHRETYDQAFAQLRTVVDQINQTSKLPVLDCLYPSVRLGVDMAVRSKTYSSMPNHEINLNGLIWSEGKKHIHHLLDQGYSCLKLKVGREDIEQEINRVRDIRDHIQSRAVIRLDANRLWSLDQAVRFGRALGPHGIEYMEEPTKDPSDQTKFYHETDIPFAWDESLMDCELLPKPGLVALVIKPACMGRLDIVDRLVTWAKDHGRQAVISSVFESCRCLLFYARYCADKHLTKTHHGLDTWRWLKDDPNMSNLVVKHGSMEI